MRKAVNNVLHAMDVAFFCPCIHGIFRHADSFKLYGGFIVRFLRRAPYLPRSGMSSCGRIYNRCAGLLFPVAATQRKSWPHQFLGLTHNSLSRAPNLVNIPRNRIYSLQTLEHVKFLAGCPLKPVKDVDGIPTEIGIFLNCVGFACQRDGLKFGSSRYPQLGRSGHRNKTTIPM